MNNTFNNSNIIFDNNNYSSFLTTISSTFIILIIIGISCWCSCYTIYILNIFRLIFKELIQTIISIIRLNLSNKQKDIIIYIYNILFSSVINIDYIIYLLYN